MRNAIKLRDLAQAWRARNRSRYLMPHLIHDLDGTRRYARAGDSTDRFDRKRFIPTKGK